MNRTPMSQSYVNSQAGGQQQQQQPQQPQQQQQQSESQQQPSSSATNSGGQQQQQQLIIGQGGGGGEQMSQLMCATELTNLLLEFAFSVFVNKPQDIVDYAANYFNQLRQQRQQLLQTTPTATTTMTNSTVVSAEQVAGGVGGPAPSAFSGQKRASSDSQRSNDSIQPINNQQQQHQLATSTSNSNQSESDEFEFSAGEQPQPHQQPAGRTVNFGPAAAGRPADQMGRPRTSYNRRKSVFAEQYDPANDQEEDENNRVVHSKTDEQRLRLAKAIKAIFLFRSVEPQDVTQLLDAMFEVRVRPGDVVIRQGDDGDNFYVVERGKFQIYVQQEDGTKQVRGEYEHNGFFGELALMYNQPRAATVVALSEGSLWAMDRNTFRRIVLKSAFKKRKEYEALFEKVSVLQCLNGYERMNLCDALESKRFLNGQMIIVQGDQANGMYFIESGNVKIVKQLEDGRVMDVAILGKGDYFGELALINHKPRAASVYAMGDDVKLAFLDVKAFERLLGSCIERMEKNCAIYLNELAHQEGRQNV